ERSLRILLNENFRWLDERAPDEFVRTANAAGFSAIMPRVWHGRGVGWASELPKEPLWEKNPAAPKDPLAMLIKKAHAAGLEVHPWFTVTLRQRNFYNEYWDEGTPEKSFDVHRPEFRAFITGVVMEVVQKYPVDGINLDYIRAKG